MHSNRFNCCLILIISALFSMQAFAVNKASEMTNSAIGQTPVVMPVESPAAYYVNRMKALKLVRQENWQAAKPVIESLTSQYPDDGDTWYILGLAYFQLQQWQESIDAFKRTLALGTILSNIPTGSAPSNDIMISIAEAYAELGDNKNAMTWINKSLNARYDGRKDLIGNAHFKNLSDSAAFQKAAGSFLPKNLTRIQSWQYDLKFLVSEIKRLHVNLFHSTTKEQFEQHIATLTQKIPTLTDQEIVFEFMTLVASVGNGHNFIVPTYSEKGSFNQLPFQFYQFSDGMFIVGADSDYQHFIGHKVIAIGNASVEQALKKTQLVNARDNEMQHLWLGPHYLSLVEVLAGLNIVSDINNISITLESASGEQDVIKPKLRAMSFNGFPKLPALAGNNAIHNLRIDKTYWYQLLPDEKAIYVQYNFVHNNASQSFADFNNELQKKITQPNVDNIILDLRHNAGGDGSTYPPMLKTLVNFEVLKPNGKIFVLIGRNTFSAAHNLLLDINRLTTPILVGEPSGSRPNALGEAGWFKLPYSGTWGVISSQFHQASKAEDHRIWVAPHVPVGLSSQQYFAGDDPALAAIFNITSLSQN